MNKKRKVLTVAGLVMFAVIMALHYTYGIIERYGTTALYGSHCPRSMGISGAGPTTGVQYLNRCMGSCSCLASCMRDFTRCWVKR